MDPGSRPGGESCNDSTAFFTELSLVRCCSVHGFQICGVLLQRRIRLGSLILVVQFVLQRLNLLLLGGQGVFQCLDVGSRHSRCVTELASALSLLAASPRFVPNRRRKLRPASEQ